MVSRLARPRDVAFAVLAGITGVAGSYAAAGATPGFVIAPIDAAVVRLTPGALVAWMIVNVGSSAHLLHVALSIAIVTAAFTGFALLGLLLARRVHSTALGALVSGLLAWGLAAALTANPRLALAAGVPVGLFAALGMTPGRADTPAGSTPGSPTPDGDRRRLLGAAASALAFVAIGLGSQFLATQPGQTTSRDPEAIDDEVEPLLEQATDYELDVVGDIPGLVSPIGEFYNVDINQFDPDYPSDEWALHIAGDVGNEVTFDFDDLQQLPVEHRYVTLRCVGESLNGRKLDNAVWTGTPLKALLDVADPGGDCGCAMLYAKDGYFVQFPTAALETAFLAWGMNGQPLPKEHGHPVRLLVPGHWGETNVKWLNEIELLDEELDGYWERRGWHGTGPVNTVAKLWSDTILDDGRIELAGHAYAGIRGIDRVEVSVDGGQTWTDAELSAPLPADDVWRQWRHVYEATAAHEVVVRATDGDGVLQPAEQRDSFPSGSTGWVSKMVYP
jgi:DMSO/TMAO reductase YedYZ molybdopterin-dependent catalytic subunit